MNRINLLFTFVVFLLLPVRAVEDATGSGCAISENHVLTAYHVVDDAEKIVVSFGTSIAMKASVIKKNIIDDWAVLKLDGKAPACVVCANKGITLGDKIYTLGYPSSSLLGEDIKYADGVVSALSGLGSNNNAFQFSVPIQPGNSGGPLFNVDGQMIGIVQSSINPEAFYKATGGALPQNINFGCPISTLRKTLEDIITSSDEKITIEKNQSATCLIKVSLATRKEKVVTNKTSKKIAPIQKEREYKVSRRYKQLENYLDDVASGIFKLPNGDDIDVRTEDGYLKLDKSLQVTYEYMCLEVHKNFTDTSQVVKFNNNSKCLVFRARNRMSQTYNNANQYNKENSSFFGLNLGDTFTTDAADPGNKKVYLNGFLSKRFELIPRTVYLADLLSKNEYKSYYVSAYRGCAYRVYRVKLLQPVLGIEKLYVYTTKNNLIFAIDAETSVCIDNIIRAFEKKLGMKFSVLADNDESVNVDFHHCGDYQCRIKDVHKISTSRWRLNIFSHGNKKEKHSIWVGLSNLYEMLMEEEQQERERRARDRVNPQNINIEGL